MGGVLPVSLVIPCYGRDDQTTELLGSLLDADFRCEVILVDDASPTPLDRIARLFPSLALRYIRNEKNAGPAFCRNLGVEEAESELIAFTDNDCLVSRHWLNNLYEAASRSPATIAAVGGRTIAAGSDVFSRYYDYHKILDPWYFRGKIHYITTANAIFKRGPFEIVGGFDTAVRQAGGEDPGICFKLQNAGYGLGYAPDAIIRHQYEARLRAFIRTFYRYGYGCAGQSARHFRAQDFVVQNSYGALDAIET